MDYRLNPTTVVNGVLRLVASKFSHPATPTAYSVNTLMSIVTGTSLGIAAETAKAGSATSVALFGDLSRPQLVSIGMLGDGWNGHGSLAPSPESLESIGRLLTQLPAELSSPDLTPNDNGTISVEWENARGYVHLEVGATRYALTIAAARLAPRFYNGLTPALDADFVAERASSALFQTRRESRDVTLSRVENSFALQSA